MNFALVKEGVVLETYRYADEIDMKEHNHPDFYPYMFEYPIGLPVRRGWSYNTETQEYTEPEAYSWVDYINEQYLPTDQQRIEELENEAKLLREQNNALSERNTFIEDCIAEMASLVYA